MTWVALRQNRLGIYAGLAVLIALAAFLVPTGVSMLARFEDSGLKACMDAADGGCTDLAQRFFDSYRSLWSVMTWLNFIPAIIGLVLAAPIVLDLEQRTYRLAWTQSITRRRWIAVKLGMALLGAVVFAAAATALLTWWLAPQDRVYGPLENSFNYEGVAPFAFTIFSLALALAVGVLTRRIIVVFAVTLGGFLGARLFVEVVLRPNYMAPVERITPLTGDSPPGLTGQEWVLSGRLIDQAGNPLSVAQAQELCGGFVQGPGLANNPQTESSLFECLDGAGIMSRLLFHPADRFWTFQAIEAAIFLGAAAVLLGLTVWVVSRRMR